MATMNKDDMKRALFGTYPTKEIDTSTWKSFKLGDWFDIHPTKAYKLTNRDLFNEDGINPVIGNSSYNNGITGYSNLDTTEANIITFSDTTSGTNTMFYQDMKFIGYPHVQGMYAREGKNIVITTATQFKTYQVSYFNTLKMYINSLKRKKSVAAVQYGMAIPKEHQSEVLKTMLAANGGE